MHSFGGFHDGFRKGWMGMDGQSEVGCVGAHFDRQDPLGDQLAGTDTGYADTEYPFGLRIDQQLGQAVAASQGGCAAGGRPRETTDGVIDTLLFGLGLGQIRPRRSQGR